MLGKLAVKLFGNKHEREIKRIKPIVEKINSYYEEFHTLTDGELRAKTDVFKQRIRERTEPFKIKIERLKEELAESFRRDESLARRDAIREEIARLEEEEKKATAEVLDEILPEAYAVVKETCRRLVGKRWKVCGLDIVWDMIPFDVQLIGAVVLHEGKIAEMATGEGKTLVATMPLYLNALPGKGVHLVTVNDYLARRDREWMGPIYEFLGLTVDCIQNDMDTRRRKIAYQADITYGTNNEFGFDYLRDNMAITKEDVVQRGHNYAIVDEVDFVLIDEARTPLIISGPVAHSTHKYEELKPAVERLVKNQTILVNRIVAEAERLLEEGKEYEAGIKLLQAQRGAPKNKRLAKLLQEPGIKKLIRRVENDFLRDKRMGEIDADLFFSIDERSNTIDLTEKGRLALAPNNGDMFVLPDLETELAEIEGDERLSKTEKQMRKEKIYKEYAEKSQRVHDVSQLLKAYSLFEKDVEYVVMDGRVIIVDEFTGRLMPGRRYSDGLHQALEAKENVRVERETQTLATITLQNYFRLYDKLAGMTGTAETEAAEFWEIYKLDVVVIPTNKPVRRIDYEDRIYRTKREKYKAIIDEIIRMHKRRRPVLVGTISVEVSETLSRMLKRHGIRHSVLNAKHHQQEAEIIAKAGQPGAVTIATNMAGRGTDIKLGPGVVRCPEGCYLIDSESRPIPPHINLEECMRDMPCGLHIIGTERHEARRIDRQLRGRSGRQGDPGSSRFYLSLEDDLMRLFGSDRIAGVMDKLGVQEGEVIQHPLVTKSIERAQKRVEMENFSIRKHLLEYDDVMNQQREVIYDRRSYALQEENLKDEILQMIDEFLDEKVSMYTDPKTYPEEWDWESLKADLLRVMLIDLPFKKDEIPYLKPEDVFERLKETALEAYKRREETLGVETMRQLERIAMLKVIDERWKEHLYEMDLLKEGIGLRAYGQKDPLLEYKQESFRMFTEMLSRINEGVLEAVFKAQPVVPIEAPLQRAPQRISTIHQSTVGMGFQRAPQPAESQPGKRKPVKVGVKIGRNDPCPCGSGKKYKHCCGRV